MTSANGVAELDATWVRPCASQCRFLDEPNKHAFGIENNLKHLFTWVNHQEPTLLRRCSNFFCCSVTFGWHAPCSSVPRCPERLCDTDRRRPARTRRACSTSMTWRSGKHKGSERPKTSDRAFAQANCQTSHEAHEVCLPFSRLSGL